ncbi:nuclear transport factor 2 family protein [Pseudoduganella plicata]|uniref:Nuclear transport factor 2 family protein n=1 Tax=Pseudoduganella plicata TaxID=321984 RepID=A0A4P7BBN7_9BURK|nr:nuclear transport factor 2 family protein [Pseudoduganella plicata]QBQ35493.1 nuclear transport factor 2 family protein [Pseudoduganella plicata]GGY97457.1 hypothetical protein GCM10007388_33950 [Pseudoduganella plicata]
MSDTNKAILQAANAAVTAGDNETFLSHCADDIEWSTVGGETLHGKDAVRQWMATEYTTPPAFSVHALLADGDHVIALGDITANDAAGKPIPHAYCDVWRFRDGKMVELRAFVIPVGG